jgi:fibronectin-binding autotransporter adhesin
LDLGTGTVTNSAGGLSTLTVGGNISSGSFGGVIQNGTGTVGLAKVGTGTQTLGGASSYSAGTTISQGTLIGASNTAFGTAAITLGDADTGANDIALLLANSVDITNAVAVSAIGSGTVTIGTIGTSIAFNPTIYAGTITLNRATTFSSTVSDRLAINGQVTVPVGALTVSGGARTTLLSTANNFVGNILITGSGTILQASVKSAGEVIPDASNGDVVRRCTSPRPPAVARRSTP